MITMTKTNLQTFNEAIKKIAYIYGIIPCILFMPLISISLSILWISKWPTAVIIDLKDIL
jgi:hypothetical protein